MVPPRNQRSSDANRNQRKASPPSGGMRPLYDDAQHALLEKGNSGLWYDKFFDQWSHDWKILVQDGKRDWIKKIANINQNDLSKKVGNDKILAEAVRRCEQLVKARRGQCFMATTVSHFVSGLGRSHPIENGFAWRHDTGAPYLPGSSIKGLTRAYARAWCTADEISEDGFNRVFSPDSTADLQVGTVLFLDALPIAPTALVVDVMTPHYTKWYEEGCSPGDWFSPVPIPFLAVAQNQTFLFSILPRDPSQELCRKDCEVARRLLIQALELLGAGAKTAVGYGRFFPHDNRPDSGIRPGRAKTTSQAGGHEGWKKAIVYDEIVTVIEDRGETILICFDDGDVQEVNKSKAKWKG